DHADELLHLVGCARLAFDDLAAAARNRTGVPGQHLQRVDATGAQGEEDDDDDDQGGEAEAASSTSHGDAYLTAAEAAGQASPEAASAFTSHVPDVVALAAAFPQHDGPSMNSSPCGWKFS